MTSLVSHVRPFDCERVEVGYVGRRAVGPEKGKFGCPKCGRQFVAPTEPEPVCLRCRVVAMTICRRCDHPRPWVSAKRQYCKPCMDFLKFRQSGGLSATPTGRLSDRPSRARRVPGT